MLDYDKLQDCLEMEDTAKVTIQACLLLPERQAGVDLAGGVLSMHHKVLPEKQNPPWSICKTY